MMYWMEDWGNILSYARASGPVTVSLASSTAVGAGNDTVYGFDKGNRI